MARIALYPGSFDPITNGHIDILMQALAIADTVIVGIGISATKNPLFSFEERAEMIAAVMAEHGVAAERVKVRAFKGLVVHFAEAEGAAILIRGLRDGTDLDFEMQMAGMNGTMVPHVRTVFLPASPPSRHITATLVRQIASMGGDVTPFVPGLVAPRLKAKFPT
jgi:pantetheine-phosphate adenylyltransferase